jgi:hypothetical protein
MGFERSAPKISASLDALFIVQKQVVFAVPLVALIKFRITIGPSLKALVLYQAACPALIRRAEVSTEWCLNWALESPRVRLFQTGRPTTLYV